MRVCYPALRADGKHVYVREGFYMVCKSCFGSQVYTDNPGPNWVSKEENDKQKGVK